MKKIPVLALSTFAIFSLTGCGMLQNIMSELQKTPDSLPKTKEEARNALYEYAESKKGLELQYMYRDGDIEGTSKVGVKDGSIWEIYETDDGVTGYVAIHLEDDTYDKYIYDGESFKFDRHIKGYSAQDVKKDIGSYNSTNWVFFAHSQTLSKKSESKVLNRPCTDYEFTYNGIANQLGEESDYLVSIDNELCITMKIAIYQGSSSSGRVNMDMTAMVTGNDVQIPEVDEKPAEDESLEYSEPSEESSSEEAAE